MNIKEFYQAVGGNYDNVLICLGKEERIRKFVRKFPESDTVVQIKDALNKKDYESAFREAHNLKGMSINIGLVNLNKVSSDLTESLRNGPKGNVNELFQKVESEYKHTCELISTLS